jgi:hypothetical protein
MDSLNKTYEKAAHLLTGYPLNPNQHLFATQYSKTGDSRGLRINEPGHLP